VLLARRAGQERRVAVAALPTAREREQAAPYTVFAPTDRAFKKVPAKTLEALGNDRKALRRVLLYHVADGRYPAARVAGKRSIPTLAGARVEVETRKGVVRVGGARVVTADVRASNGVIHAINPVLIPPK
jgi:uncharacterized surface protein with fasciclin (FAS1) repeats